MRIPSRSRFGFGVIDGYSSDSAYLTAVGSSPKRGDVYFNTTSQRYRFYDGDEWKELSPQAFPQARLIDHTFASVPSGSQTVDGLTAVPGDIVILANYDDNAYRVQLGAWTLEPLFPTGSAPSQGDGAYIKEGSVYGDTLQWYDGSTWRLLTILTEGTAVDQVPHWDGTRYVANPDFLASGSTLTTKDDNVNDATQAQGIALVGGDKTAGTGDGGDVILTGGSSVGGQEGRVEIDALATTFVNKAVLPASPVLGDWLMYNGRFRYWDGTQWSLIYPLPTGTVLNSILAWNGSDWVEDPLLTASGSSIGSPDDTNNNAFAPTPVFVTGANKTAGTGDGGDVRLAGGTSFGGARGKVRFNRIEVDYPTLVTGTSTMYVLDDTVIDAAKAASFAVHASNKTAGTGDGGDLLLSGGTSVGGIRGRVIIDGSFLNIGPSAAADPVSGMAVQDVYYNSTEQRFKYYDGSNWRPLGGSGGPFVIDYIDTVSTTLPVSAPFSPDGTPVVTGDLVLFKNLSSPAADDRVYKATVSGPSITWALQIFGQSPSSVPTDGDGVYVRSGTANADTLWFYNGTDWYNYGAALSGHYWKRSGNAGTVAGTDFIGTTDAVDLVLKTNNVERLRLAQTYAQVKDLPLSVGSSAPTEDLHIRFNKPEVKILVQNDDTSPTSLSGIQFLTGASPNRWQIFGRNNQMVLGIALVGDYVTFDSSNITSALNLQFTPAADHSISIQQVLSNGTGRRLTVAGGAALGTDQNGGGLTFAVGQSTGTGSSASQIWQLTNPSTVTGSSLRPLYDAMLLDHNMVTGGISYPRLSLSDSSGNDVLSMRHTATQALLYGFLSSNTKTFEMVADGNVSGTDQAGVSTLIKSSQSTGSAGSRVEIWAAPAGLAPGATPRPAQQIAAFRGDVMQLGSPSVYAEFVPLQSFTIANNQASPTDVFAIASATYTSIFVEYSLIRNGIVATGLITIANDGSATPGFSDTGSSTGATGVTFSATVSGGLIRLQYISDNTASGTMKYHVRRW